MSAIESPSPHPKTSFCPEKQTLPGVGQAAAAAALVVAVVAVAVEKMAQQQKQQQQGTRVQGQVLQRTVTARCLCRQHPSSSASESMGSMRWTLWPPSPLSRRSRSPFPRSLSSPEPCPLSQALTSSSQGGGNKAGAFAVLWLLHVPSPLRIAFMLLGPMVNTKHLECTA